MYLAEKSVFYRMIDLFLQVAPRLLILANIKPREGAKL
jgi:hypothetical protein